MTENKTQEEESIIFYCKDCEDIVDAVRIGSKYVYKCKKCGTKNVAFGTTKSIHNFFRLDEVKKPKRDEKFEDTRGKLDEKGNKIVEENLPEKTVENVGNVDEVAADVTDENK